MTQVAAAEARASSDAEAPADKPAFVAVRALAPLKVSASAGNQVSTKLTINFD